MWKESVFGASHNLSQLVAREKAPCKIHLRMESINDIKILAINSSLIQQYNQTITSHSKILLMPHLNHTYRRLASDTIHHNYNSWNENVLSVKPSVIRLAGASFQDTFLRRCQPLPHIVLHVKRAAVFGETFLSTYNQ